MYKMLTRLLAVSAFAATTMFFAPASQAQGSYVQVPAASPAAPGNNAPAAPAGQAKAYVPVNPPMPSDTPGKIEVIEFFAYSCPHCAHMEPMVLDWVKKAPADVVLKQVPVAFNASMKPMQQLYYTLEALGRSDLHPKVFDAIHVDHLRLFDKKAMGDWAAKQGLDRAKFDSVFDSFSVQTEVQRATQLTQAYAIDGTPSFGVGGKFLTSPVMAGNSYEGALAEVDKLIPMARNAAN